LKPSGIKAGRLFFNLSKPLPYLTQPLLKGEGWFYRIDAPMGWVGAQFRKVGRWFNTQQKPLPASPKGRRISP
jgi:hypothetical protein